MEFPETQDPKVIAKIKELLEAHYAKARPDLIGFSVGTFSSRLIMEDVDTIVRGHIEADEFIQRNKLPDEEQDKYDRHHVISQIQEFVDKYKTTRFKNEKVKFNFDLISRSVGLLSRKFGRDNYPKHNDVRNFLRTLDRILYHLDFHSTYSELKGDEKDVWLKLRYIEQWYLADSYVGIKMRYPELDENN